MTDVTQAIRVADMAFFFDFDGTLAPIAPHPDQVRLDPALHHALQRLHNLSAGAVAVLSGRRRDELARFLPAGMPLAGLHGWDMDGMDASSHARALDGWRDELTQIGNRHPGTLVEDKGAALALHWRLAPGAEGVLTQAARRAVDALGSDWTLQPGKCVVEIRPNGGDKGDALRRFMQQPPFKGRRPMAFGDDLTDIPMLHAAQAAGGIAVAIGERDLPCDLRLATPADLANWLKRSLDPA